MFGLPSQAQIDIAYRFQPPFDILDGEVMDLADVVVLPAYCKVRIVLLRSEQFLYRLPSSTSAVSRSPLRLILFFTPELRSPSSVSLKEGFTVSC